MKRFRDKIPFHGIRSWLAFRILARLSDDLMHVEGREPVIQRKYQRTYIC